MLESLEEEGIESNQTAPHLPGLIATLGHSVAFCPVDGNGVNNAKSGCQRTVKNASAGQKQD